MRTVVASMIVLGLVAGAAHAGIETTFAQVNTVEIDGSSYNVYEMRVTPDLAWIISTLEMALTTGTLYQHPAPFGSNTERHPGLFAFAPDLEWDTYVTTPGGYAEQTNLTPGSVMSATTIDIGWYCDPFVPQIAGATYKVAQITLSADAEGTLGGKSYNLDHDSPDPDVVSFDGMYTFIGGHIPEPATLALLAVGGLAVLRRRSTQVMRRRRR